MVNCLIVPSDYLNQYWLIINVVLWYSHKNNFTGIIPDICSWYDFENAYF